MICPASETEGRRALIDEGPFLFYMYNLDEDRKQQPAAEYEKEKRGRPAALVSLCLQIGDVVKLLRQSRCDLQMILKKKEVRNLGQVPDGLLQSGRQDSNLRPHGPQPCALAKLSHAPQQRLLL